jgi:hypothetical protein
MAESHFMIYIMLSISIQQLLVTLVWFNNLMTGGGGSGKVENMGFSESAPRERVAQDH